MSDMDDRPSDLAVAQKLRDIVISTHKAGKVEELTVKRIRTRAEAELSLPDGFFKTDSTWKQKSHDTIHAAVDEYCGDDATPEPTPQKPTKPPPKEKKASAPKNPIHGVKRKATVPVKKAKKRRKAESDEESEAESSGSSSEPPKKPAQRARKVVAEESEEEEEESPRRAAGPAKRVAAEDSDDKSSSLAKKPKDVSDSELSSLIDESPKPKRSQKTAPTTKSKKPAAPAKPKAVPAESSDPDTPEIKRLQSWLVKCGIRKVWSKELVKCSTSKDKIAHLKAMLKDAGMDGKYSVEKAAKIKEQREFAKDLEAIQEGEMAWGQGAEEINGRPRRRAAARVQPVQKVVFSDDAESESGEEEENDEESEEGNEEETGEESQGGDSVDEDSE